MKAGNCKRVQPRDFHSPAGMSALPHQADILSDEIDVRKVPLADYCGHLKASRLVLEKREVLYHVPALKAPGQSPCRHTHGRYEGGKSK